MYTSLILLYPECHKSLTMKNKIGRNEICPCGSGLKYKKCCGKNNTIVSINSECEHQELESKEYYSKNNTEQKNTFMFLTKGDGKTDETYKLTTARKNHLCENCSKNIVPGDKYYRIVGSPQLISMICRDLPPDNIVLKKVCEECLNNRTQFHPTDESLNKFDEKNVSKSSRDIKPDFNDPFAPCLESDKMVECLHCGEEYKENEIKWDGESEYWVCKNWPSCDGTGLGFDIFLKEQ